MALEDSFKAFLDDLLVRVRQWVRATFGEAIENLFFGGVIVAGEKAVEGEALKKCPKCGRHMGFVHRVSDDGVYDEERGVRVYLRETRLKCTNPWCLHSEPIEFVDGRVPRKEKTPEGERPPIVSSSSKKEVGDEHV